MRSLEFLGAASLLSYFAAHRDKLFRSGGVNTDRSIKLRLGGAAVERYSESLNDLTGIRSNHVAAKHPIRRLIDDQLHHGPFVSSGERMSEGLIESPVDIYFDVPLARFRLGETDRTATGRTENRGGHV